jgi:hypothetical protein
MKTLIDYLQERMGLVAGTCYGLLCGVVALAFMVDRGHAHSWVEQNIPFFWSLFGFGAAAIIIGFVYWFGHSGIMTRPDYYDSMEESCCDLDKEPPQHDHH